MSLAKRVKMVEVGPRDGLQNEANSLDIATRVEFINRLSLSGLQAIEVGSFVRADRIPQMRGTAGVYQGITKVEGISYPVLVPNARGLEAALSAGVKEIAVFASASEAFSQNNINCSIDESLDRFSALAPLAQREGLRIRGYVSCVAGCPYQGSVSFESILGVTKALLAQGCYEVSLGDTIGVATPALIEKLIDFLSNYIAVEQLALHCHDTYGQALANIYAGLLKGISVIDSSVAGLGGCPYAKGASGNVASEDVLYMLNGLGIETGVDLKLLADAGRYISEQLGRQSNSKVYNAAFSS